VIVLKFGSIYCSSCVKSIQALSDLQVKYPEDTLKVVAINLDIYGTFRVRRFYRGYKDLVKYPVMIDENLDVSRTYGVTTLPSIVIIDKEGKVARIMVGYQEEELTPIIDFAEKATEAGDITELAGLLPTGDRPLSVLFPNNFTKTQQDSLYIIGRVSKPGTKVVLMLNGGSRQEVEPDRNIFYIRSPISLGSNFIELSVPGEGGAKKFRQAIVIFRDPKLGRGFETQFPTYSFHIKENEEVCAECHDVTPPESGEQNFMMVTSTCLECHKELSEKDYVHGPITVGGCAPCHDFGSVPTRYNLFTAGSQLCYSCHAEKEEEYARSYIHGPLAAGVCSVCHNPHGSNEKFQLRVPQGQLCMMCHQKTKEQTYSFYPHPPFEEGKCADCHNPHSSDNARFFLLKNGDDLCYECHDVESMDSHRHPNETVPNFTYPGIKLTELGELMCSSCHNPHASDSEKMLPLDGCPACHSY
jgi:predicted CXXCH cytochrome family protein